VYVAAPCSVYAHSLGTDETRGVIQNFLTTCTILKFVEDAIDSYGEYPAIDDLFMYR